jgi:protein SCO1/2
MTGKIRLLLLCAIALTLIGATGLTILTLIRESGSQITRSLTGAIGGPFTLTASDGRTVTDQTYRGKWVLIYFGYTSCTDDCPTALNNMGGGARSVRPRSRCVAAGFHHRGPEA